MTKGGRPFYKMSGSGNDFVMIDTRQHPPGDLERAERVSAICARATGVGADGIVFVSKAEGGVGLVYLNADGSRADLCGNATLCTTRLAVELGMADPAGFVIQTDSGPVAARITGEIPEIDLQPVRDVRPELAEIKPVAGEERIGFALAGVPHLVVLCADATTVDVVGRGRPLRNHASLAAGANVNFVSRRGSEWRVRTYERGVEGETLACGSGAVATAVLLTEWGLANPGEGPVSIRTTSNRVLRVRLNKRSGEWLPSLSGEARLVFKGELQEI